MVRFASEAFIWPMKVALPLKLIVVLEGSPKYPKFLATPVSLATPLAGILTLDASI